MKGTNMKAQTQWSQVIRPAIVAIIVLTIITGVIYPLLMTVISQAMFPYQANGSLIKDADGNIVGSELIGQQFSNPAYFWGRLSATGPVPYNAAASSGSNYGPLNPALIGADGSVESRITALKDADAAAGVTNDLPIPVDLVTSSASGLDPHISPAAAKYQLQRVAALRGTDVPTLQGLVDQFTTERLLGLIGEPTVNVLELNLALDKQFPLAQTSGG
jgi:K+-transporting ATPase ATPase C chain